MKLFNGKNFNFKLNFRGQLFLAFLTLSTLVILTSFLSLIFLNRLERHNNQLIGANWVDHEAAKELQAALSAVNAISNRYLLEHDPELIPVYEQKLLHLRTWLALAAKRFSRPEDRLLLDSLTYSFKQYQRLNQKLLELGQQNLWRDARQLHKGALQTQYAHLNQIIERLITNSDWAMRQTQTLLHQDYRSVKRLLVGVVIGSVFLAGGLSFWLSRRLMRPIYRLVLNLKGATGEASANQVEISNFSELDDLSYNINLLIDKIRSVNANLTRSQQLLVRTEKLAALGRMAAGLAHEIRNPLTSIKILLYSLEQDLSDNPRHQQDLQVIRQEIDRVEKFIQTFLDFARPQQPQWSTFRFNECIRQVLQLMAPQIKKEKVKLALNLKTNSDWVKADRNQMQQVLHNIILNALQAMPHGGVLTIATESLINDTGLPYLQVRIADTGRGIHPEILNSLFDPFVTTKEDGSGLGLAIVHQLVTTNGGWVEAGNNPDRGAYFTINLPQEKTEP